MFRKSKVSIYMPDKLLEGVRRKAEEGCYDLSQYFIELARRDVFGTSGGSPAPRDGGEVSEGD